MAHRFSRPPSSDSVEWAGRPLGASRNTVTATRSRTPVYDKTIDASPGKLLDLVRTAQAFAQATRAAGGKVFRRDAVIHGVRVRCFTNSPHLEEFWRANWFDPAEWAALTGRPAPRRPGVKVYAFAGSDGQGQGGSPAAYYSRRENTVVFFNTAYYGQLKSWVLGAVGRLLADTEGIHSIHGAAVKHGQSGVLFIAPTGTGKSTSSYGLMADGLETWGPGSARFHSDDWVYVRYFFPTRQGALVAPREVRDGAGRQLARGFRCQAWLRGAVSGMGSRAAAHVAPDATIFGVAPAGAAVEVRAADIDMERPPVALAYISEKTFYLRTNLVESYPAAAAPMTRTLLENVPDTVDGEAMAAIDGVAAAEAGSGRGAGAGGDGEARAGIGSEDLARLAAFDNARALLTAESVFGAEAVYANPSEPLRITHVFLLRRDFADPTVLENLTLAGFCGRLMLGRTPEGKSEVAYNAYRAVDDAAEATYLAALAAGNGKPLGPAAVFAKHLRTRDRGLGAVDSPAVCPPDSLIEEFELFQTLYASTRAFLVNTVLQAAPGLGARSEAVHATRRLIVAAINLSAGRTLPKVNLNNWRRFAGADGVVADAVPLGGLGARRATESRTRRSLS